MIPIQVGEQLEHGGTRVLYIYFDSVDIQSKQTNFENFRVSSWTRNAEQWESMAALRNSCETFKIYCK